jgi:hypothetical protein
VSNFEFVFSLFGLLLGLALAEVLGGLSDALQERRKLKVGWLTPLLGLLLVLDISSFWTVAWSIRDAFRPDYFHLLCGVLITGTYYFAACLVFPKDPAEWPDFDVYYFRHKRVVLGGVTFCNVLAYAAQQALGGEPLAAPLDKLVAALFFPGLLAAIWAPGKRLNVALLAFLVVQYPVFASLYMLGYGPGSF